MTGSAAGVHTIDKAISDDYDARGTFVPTKATGHFDAAIVRVMSTTHRGSEPTGATRW